MYPGKLQIKDDKNIYIMNTLFNLPETFLISALVDYFDNNEEYENTDKGWTKQDSLTSFVQVFQASYSRHQSLSERACSGRPDCRGRYSLAVVEPEEGGGGEARGVRQEGRQAGPHVGRDQTEREEGLPADQQRLVVHQQHHELPPGRSVLARSRRLTVLCISRGLEIPF